MFVKQGEESEMHFFSHYLSKKTENGLLMDYNYKVTKYYNDLR